MQNTRQRIMNYLETHNQATVVELSQVLNMTQANIRHHLSILRKEGRVEIVGHNQPPGRGRPNFLYMPTHQAQKHSLNILATLLLDEIQSISSTKKRESRIKQLAEQLATNGKIRGRSITIRLGESMQRMNALNYQAHWEARADSPIIVLGKCPYAPIIDQYPELCVMDKYILETMLDLNVDQISKITRKPEGSKHCLFAIKSLLGGLR